MSKIIPGLTLPNRRSGIGVSEYELHPTSGLRVFPYTVDLFNNDGYLVDPAVIGSTIANNANWTNLSLPPNVDGTLYAEHLPFPMTLSVKWINTAATFGQVIALRVTGFNQFGDPVAEETPDITIAVPAGAPVGTVTTYFWLSKVFSIVTKIEYRASNVGAGNSIGIGFRWRIQRSVAMPAQTYILRETGAVGVAVTLPADYDQGIGLPVRCRSYATTGAAFQPSEGKYDILGGYIENLTSNQKYGLAPMQTGPFPAGPNGGTLIGMSGRANALEGDPNKFFPFYIAGLLDARRIDTVGVNTFAWGDNYRVHAWIRSTVGAGRHLPRSAYPTFPSSRASNA